MGVVADGAGVVRLGRRDESVGVVVARCGERGAVVGEKGAVRVRSACGVRAGGGDAVSILDVVARPGRSRQPEGATRAYLVVIQRAPKAVQKALQAS